MPCLYPPRYYDATIGRFISADTVVQNVADPQSLNLYAYCRNNPLKYVDPTGHLPLPDFFLDIAGIGYDIYQVCKDPGNWVNYVALGADVGCALLPVVTGGGAAIRSGIDAMMELSPYFRSVYGGVSNAVQSLPGLGKAAISLGDAVSPYYKFLVSGAGDFAHTIDKAWDMAGETKSSLAMGQKMHKSYRANQVLKYHREKEFTLASGRRVDFIDFDMG